MTDFKVGDKVRISNEHPIARRRGEEFTITGIEKDWGGYLKGDKDGTGVWPKYLELVEPTPKFKVGDKVRVNSKNATKVGEVFTITEICEYPRGAERLDSTYYANGDANGGGVWFHQLEHYTESDKLEQIREILKDDDDRDEMIAHAIEAMEEALTILKGLK